MQKKRAPLVSELGLLESCICSQCSQSWPFLAFQALLVLSFIREPEAALHGEDMRAQQGNLARTVSLLRRGQSTAPRVLAEVQGDYLRKEALCCSGSP